MLRPVVTEPDGWRRPPPGTVLGGRFRLDDVAWLNDEAYVYRGFDTELGRTVGVRIPRNAHVRGVASFQRQFSLLSAIDHPGVIRVHQLGVDPDVHAYLVTEQLDFRRIVDGDALTPEATMGIVAQAADALQAVHDRGIVYRNISKGLMLRDDGSVVLDGFHNCVPGGRSNAWQRRHLPGRVRPASDTADRLVRPGHGCPLLPDARSFIP